MNWYYARGETSIGPLDTAAFQRAVATGEVTEDTLVWREGMADWIPFSAVARSGDGVTMPAATESICVECGNAFPREEMIAYKSVHVCAGCKPVFFQRLQEGGVIPGQLRIATVGSRFVAKVLDYIIIIGFMFLFMAVEMLISGRGLFGNAETMTQLLFQAFTSLVSTALQVVYTTWFLGKYGATPGKLAMGLRVVRSDGDRITYLRGFARFWAEMLSGIICYLGYLMAFWDAESRRTLHDGICDTRVITIK